MLLMFSKYFTAAKDLDLNKVALGEYVRTPPWDNARTGQNQDRNSRSSSDSYILALSNSDAATLNDRQRTSVSIALGRSSNFARPPRTTQPHQGAAARTIWIARRLHMDVIIF